METLIDQFINLFENNFSLSYMLCVNVLTYLIIKAIDDLNGDKNVSTWTKRLVMIFSCFIIAIAYKLNDNTNTIILINSAIIAPVAWSWIFKPIFKRIGIDYKKIDKTNKSN